MAEAADDAEARMNELLGLAGLVASILVGFGGFAPAWKPHMLPVNPCGSTNGRRGRRAGAQALPGPQKTAWAGPGGARHSQQRL